MAVDRTTLVSAHRRGVYCTLAVGAVLAAVLALPSTARAGVIQRTIVSRPGVAWYAGRHSGSATLTFGNVGCEAVDDDGFCTAGAWPGIAGAHWIWQRTNVSEAQALHGAGGVAFVQHFTLPDEAQDITGTLSVNADNAYRVFLNGKRLGGDGFMTRHPPYDAEGWANVEQFAIAPLPGRNTLTVHVINYDGDGVPYDNPAGVIWRADISARVDDPNAVTAAQ